jgi:hypothetical protein
MIFDEKINILIQKLNSILNSDNFYLPEELSILFILDNSLIRVHKGVVNLESSRHNYSEIKGLSCNREDILKYFTKIDFIIDQLIGIRLLDNFPKNSEILGDVLEELSLAEKLNLLFKWGFLKRSSRSNWNKIRKVRNDMAHKWSTREMVYEKLKLEDNFARFRDDFSKEWKNLIEIYRSVQTKIDVEHLIRIVEGKI